MHIESIEHKLTPLELPFSIFAGNIDNIEYTDGINCFMFEDISLTFFSFFFLTGRNFDVRQGTTVNYQLYFLFIKIYIFILLFSILFHILMIFSQF